MHAADRVRRVALGILAFWALGGAPAWATPPRPPVEVRLELDGHMLVWEIEAHADAGLARTTWRSVPANALALPTLPAMLAAGQRLAGRSPVAPTTEWIELEIEANTGHGGFRIGGAARARSARPEPRLRITSAKPGPPGAAATVVARFLYEDRLLDARGYTGAVQLLPLRHADAALVDDSTGTVLASGSTAGDGTLRLAWDPAGDGQLSLRLRASTRLHPTLRLAVLDPESATLQSVEKALPHTLRTISFESDANGIDLGTLVVADPDGSGRVQAFHILDVAIDAWEALGTSDVLAHAPSDADSLRFIWSPTLRLRGTAYGGGLVQVTSPPSGDTDGWSDALLLHEIGHFVAHRWLRDTSPGGLHLLGDVEQSLELAWSEGFATAFACWVRAHRAATRRNAAGLPVDSGVALVVDVGLPPPYGMTGGLQWAWDVEAHALGDRALPRDGTGSETTIAGVLWDASDGPTSPDGVTGDDDAVALGPAPVWAALRRLRDLPAAAPVRFEDFYSSWIVLDPSGATLAPILADARIEYAPDAAEPDALVHPTLAAVRPREAAGGIVLSEIVPGPRIAVEITNRGLLPVALGGWTLVARSNTASTAPSLTYTVPEGVVLGPRGRLVVHKHGGGGADGVRDLDAPGWTVPWYPGIEGACMLFDARGTAVDFVRWNSRDGTPSRIAPPAGVGWSGQIAAAEFGESLARRPDVADRDAASDFQSREPTLGAPNDVTAIHRTFYPEGDVDALRLAPAAPGVYTLAARRLRSGAAPRLEIWITGATRPLVQADATPGGGPPRITLQLGQGEVLEARSAQAGTTRFGSYDLSFYAEPDSAMPLPPVALDASVDTDGEHGTVRLEWRNAAAYDSLQARAGPGNWRTLPADATSWEVDLPRGRHPVQIAAHAGARISRVVAMLVAVEPWSESLDEPFDSLGTGLWETSGAWVAVAAGGRTGHVLASSSGATYGNEARGEVRLRTAVLARTTTVLRFDHVCIVRPEDSARLEISEDWGATWQRLGSWNWTAATGDGGMANWRDGVADSTDWVGEELPLGAWAGSPVQVRFAFESDIYGVARGWLVDALRIEPRAPSPPARFALRLLPGVPNPFNPVTRLRYEISHSVHVMLRVYDVRGRLLCTLFDGPQTAGLHEVVWRGEDGRGNPLPSGVYVAELRTAGEARTTKLVRLD